ncbi:MAG: hypothetical protein RL318_632 [Fibrobacterota bacterium]
MRRWFMGMVVLGGLAQAAGTLGLGQPAGTAIDPRGLSGTALPVWGNQAKYQRLAEGFRRGGFSLFRFPNGTLSNEYHWNGQGAWDSLGIWHSQDSAYAPGFLTDLVHRGTTRDNYGATFPSHALDGDTASFWWGNGSPEAPPWFVVDFRTVQHPDSIEILWGKLRPGQVKIESFQGSDDHGQGPHTSMTGSWRPVGTGTVPSATTRLALQGDSSRYLALRFEGQAAAGVHVREVRVWSQGRQITRNVTVPREQTRGIGLGTAPSSEKKRAWQPRDWDFETYMATLQKEWPGSEPLITVNLGTGTPEEAAAWVHYANKVRKFGIKRWQVGNENNGDWEDGGPLDAAQIAERFLAFSRAMKAKDSTIKVLGPVYASMDWNWCGSGKLDGKSWMEAFLMRVAKAEAQDGRQWLDGIDFHAYPYWWNDGETPQPQPMMEAADRLGGHLDTLAAMMARHLTHPESREVAMSEFNATVKVTHLTLTHHTGSLVALMLGHLATRFGDRARTCLWEPSGGEPMNPDGTNGPTYGSLRIFTPPRRGLVSDLGDAPTGAFWGQVLANRWMGMVSEGLRPLPVALEGSAGLRAFGLGNGKRAAVMLVNRTGIADSVRIASLGGFSTEVEVLSWGADQYSWDGTTSQALAFPNAGPVSRPLNAGRDPVVVPPYGVVVLTFGARPLGRPKILHRAMTSATLRVGDTLGLSVSACQTGGRLSKGRWRLDGGKASDLASLDGAWDGSHEASVLSLPAGSLGIGVHQLVLEIEGEKGSRVLDTVRFEVTGEPRIARRIDDFEKEGIDWFGDVHKDPSRTRIDLKREAQIDTTGGNQGYLQLDFAIRQPTDLSYPNFVSAGLELSLKRDAEIRPAGVVFDYAAQYENGNGVVSLSFLSDLVKDYDWHRAVLPQTGGRWKRDTLWFPEFSQEGWGRPVGTLAFGTVSKVELRAQGAGAGSVKFDNFCLIGTDGKALKLPPVPATPRRRGR